MAIRSQMSQAHFWGVGDKIVRYGFHIRMFCRKNHLAARAEEGEEVIRHRYRRIQDEKFRRFQENLFVGVRLHAGGGFRQAHTGTPVAGVGFDAQRTVVHI